MMEEVCHWTLLMYGARVGFYSGSIPRLTEDIQALKPTAIMAVPRILNRLFSGIQKQLGGNVSLMVTGSAPLSEEVLQTCRLALGSSIIEGYGQTECTAMATVSWPGDWTGGHCGGVGPCCNIKLADVPELNYYAKDGRGEVVL
ncbi:hypothetical protein OESDEN_17668 [Oesophagostomum dentatum]|uniref:long-chain-fatty-acid--CoA ligase n=1 Tax=Oesophagostomum dentatum TaxID=61180 RepID=A0A0B1SBJ9_OESDE|nr:hypothetical protein OESDEN_17668 [Oesophagostomum dentatum]